MFESGLHCNISTTTFPITAIFGLFGSWEPPLSASALNIHFKWSAENLKWRSKGAMMRRCNEEEVLTLTVRVSLPQQLVRPILCIPWFVYSTHEGAVTFEYVWVVLKLARKAVDVGDAESTERRRDGSKDAYWLVLRHRQTSAPVQMHGVEQQGVAGRWICSRSKYTGCRQLWKSVNIND